MRGHIGSRENPPGDGRMENLSRREGGGGGEGKKRRPGCGYLKVLDRGGGILEGRGIGRYFVSELDFRSNHGKKGGKGTNLRERCRRPNPRLRSKTEHEMAEPGTG